MLLSARSAARSSAMGEREKSLLDSRWTGIEDSGPGLPGDSEG